MMESGIFYSTVIDPVLAGLRKRVTHEINSGEKVIDIACGTGAQLCDISKVTEDITGIDLSGSMIDSAKKNCKNRHCMKAEFHVRDATDLSVFEPGSFDVAILSLALHQFQPDLHPPVLKEMKRIANRIIIVDYAVPLPKNYAGVGSQIAEFLAGREHNRNFKQYYKLGGLNQILPANNLIIQKTVLFAKGAFQLVVCSEKL